jgi:predicted nucleic acid-binding protein
MAEAAGLKVIGLLAILLGAKQNGLVRQIRPLLEALKQQGFFMEDELYELLLRKARE